MQENALWVLEHIGEILRIAPFLILATSAALSPLERAKTDPLFVVLEKAKSLETYLLRIQNQLSDDRDQKLKRTSARVPVDLEMSLDQAFQDCKSKGFKKNWTAFLTFAITYGLKKFDDRYRAESDLIYSNRANRAEKARTNIYLKALYKRKNKPGFHSDVHLKFSVSIETLGRVAEYSKFLKCDNTELWVVIFALALRDYPVDQISQPMERYVEGFDTMIAHLLKMDELGECGDGN